VDHEPWVGYIRAVKPLFFHFLVPFLSLPLCSLLSPKILSSSPMEVGGGRKSDAVAGELSRRRHRVGAKTSSLNFLLFSYVSYPPDSVSKLKIPEKLTYDLRSRDLRFGNIPPCSLGSDLRCGVTVGVWDWRIRPSLPPVRCCSI